MIVGMLKGFDNSRTVSILGDEVCRALAAKRVIVFGVGGVGGIAVEMLARLGIANFILVDGDVVEVSNLNRQLVATIPALGRAKVEIMAERICAINPKAKVECRAEFYTKETANSFDFTAVDGVVDAIDDVWAKCDILERATAAARVIVTSGGAARRKDPTAFEVRSLAKTEGDGLARAVRQNFRRRSLPVPNVPCVFSREEPCTQDLGSLATVVTAAGVLLAHTLLNEFIKEM